MNRLKTLLFFAATAVGFTNIAAQSENKDITITASGSGKTLEEANQAALRSATEQAFGVFISSRTEVFRDQIVADQIASVSSGNIKSFEILNQDQLPDGRWGITIKAIVSVDKLTSFVQAKGIEVEIKGGMFALNIKQQLLNEEGEVKAIAEMVGLLHEPMQISFDYTIKSGDPKSLDAESKNWEIPVVVTATCNKNIDFCADYFKKTMSALSLTSAEVQTYKSLNKKIFPVSFNYNGQTATFYFRKQTSINAINSLLSNWNFYVRLFAVQSGTEENFGIGEGQLFSVCGKGVHYVDRAVVSFPSISFPSSGTIAGTFTWKDKKTLRQIEEMTGYSVKPRGFISTYKQGGYVVYEKDGHGLVAAIYDIGQYNWENAKKACEELAMNGYNDWYLPSIEDLGILYSASYTTGIPFSEAYWSSTDFTKDVAWYFDFNAGKAATHGPNKDILIFVRPVRAF